MITESLLTVVTPATTYDLVSLDVIKDELGITDTTSDLRLARWITESSQMIAAYTQRVWALESLSEMFRMPVKMNTSGYRHQLRLTRYPIVAVTTVVEDDIYSLTQGVDFEVDPASGLLYRLFQGGVPDGELAWTWHRRKVVVTYSAGYALPDGAPSLLQQAAQMMIKGRQANRTTDPTLRSYVIPGVIEKTFATPSSTDGPIPAAIAALLDSLVDRQV